MLQQIHKRHLGNEKCKFQARDVIYWPRINADIADMVQQCPTCISNHPKQIAESIQAHEVPDIPWYKVGVDFFVLDGKDYLTIVDYYSQNIEVRTMTSTTSKAVLNTMKAIFARYGTPMEVVSDNSLQLSSQEFHDFNKHWDFEHTTSSPHYPASNGQAENAVKIMKNMITKVTTNRARGHL